MYLTQKNHLTHLSKNLYNHTLYTMRQYYFANGSFLQYEQAYHYVKSHESYEQLPSQVAQQTMKVVNRSMRFLFWLAPGAKEGPLQSPPPFTSLFTARRVFCVHFSNRHVQSVYAKQEGKMGQTLAWLLWNRKQVINNYMNQAANQLIKHCLGSNIGAIMIGELKEIKQKIQLGKKTNQNFKAIPFGLFKQKLKGKCEYYGIGYLEVEERNTSKTCAQCGVVRKANRKYRGLYVCQHCGSVRNADVNGTINILKKVVPESLTRGIGNSGRVNRPVRIRLPAIVGQHPSHEAPPNGRGSSPCLPSIPFYLE